MASLVIGSPLLYPPLKSAAATHAAAAVDSGERIK
jgi:hypothetical protein